MSHGAGTCVWNTRLLEYVLVICYRTSTSSPSDNSRTQSRLDLFDLVFRLFVLFRRFQIQQLKLFKEGRIVLLGFFHPVRDVDQFLGDDPRAIRVLEHGVVLIPDLFEHVVHSTLELFVPLLQIFAVFGAYSSRDL